MTLEQYLIGDSKGERLWVKWAIRRGGNDKSGQIDRKVMMAKPKTTDGEYGFARDLGGNNKPWI